MIWIVLGAVASAFLIGYMIYAHVWFYHLKKAALACRERPGENLCVRTDGLLPRAGPRPPENAMWRVRTGMYYIDRHIVITYSYIPEHLENADLDDPATIDREMRAMEEHGRSVAALGRD